LPLISADPQQLEQVMVNLFFNAIDAMPDGGDIFVEAALQAIDGNIPAMRIAVRDNGADIDAADLPKIFQRSFSLFFPLKKPRASAWVFRFANVLFKTMGAISQLKATPEKKQLLGYFCRSNRIRIIRLSISSRLPAQTAKK
jgi:hypothetical protein